jgi:Amino acid synthesis
MDIRRIWLCGDVVLAEGGLPALMRVTCVAACAVIANPFSGQPIDDLAELVPFGAGLGELLVKEALALLTRPAIAACRSSFPPLDITTTVSGLIGGAVWSCESCQGVR